VYLVIVFLSVILSMLWLSSKLKRNLIIAQNLTRRPFWEIKGPKLLEMVQIFFPPQDQQFSSHINKEAFRVLRAMEMHA
jgi:hypothetical protein